MRMRSVFFVCAVRRFCFLLLSASIKRFPRRSSFFIPFCLNYCFLRVYGGTIRLEKCAVSKPVENTECRAEKLVLFPTHFKFSLKSLYISTAKVSQYTGVRDTNQHSLKRL